MSGYYLAPCLEVLRAEINARWPRRDKASDGWIGDPAHQATKSDHNPNSRGSVNALDIDEDGLDFAEVFAAIKRHPSARYVIYERRLYHRLRGWRAEPYSGVNPHDKHFHLSIDQTRAAEQDRRPWGLLEDDMTEDERKKLDEVHTWLRRIHNGTLGNGNALQWWIRALANRDDPVLAKHQPDFKPIPGPGLAQLGQQLAALRADVTALSGRDVVDEPAIVQGVLAGLGDKRTADVAAALVAAGQDPAVLAAELTKLAGTQQQG